VIRYDADLRRVYVLGRRLHHGLAGALLAAAGIVLMWDDRHDVPWRFSRGELEPRMWPRAEVVRLPERAQASARRAA
jgi:hypothetical protein